jgi:hypothetical protein
MVITCAILLRSCSDGSAGRGSLPTELGALNLDAHGLAAVGGDPFSLSFTNTDADRSLHALQASAQPPCALLPAASSGRRHSGSQRPAVGL